MRTIAILNQKGGVGKTTTTVNLGAGLADRGRRVLLVDMDPQAHLSLHLGIEPGDDAKTVYDVLTAGAPLGQAVVKRSRNLDVVPSHLNLAGAEVELVNTIGRESLLRDAVAEAKADYDYMLIDCPPSLGVLTLNALVACREVFIPLQTHFLAMQGMSQLLETTQLVCRRLNPQVRVTGIIFCQFDRRTSLSREVVGEVRGYFETGGGRVGSPTVFQTNIRQSVRLAEAPSFGKTIFEYDRNSPGAADYNRLALEVLRQDGHAVSLEEPVPVFPGEPTGNGNGTAPKPAGRPSAPPPASPREPIEVLEPAGVSASLCVPPAARVNDPCPPVPSDQPPPTSAECSVSAPPVLSFETPDPPTTEASPPPVRVQQMPPTAGEPIPAAPSSPPPFATGGRTMEASAPVSNEPLAEIDAVPCVEVKVGDPASIMRTLWEGTVSRLVQADADTQELTPIAPKVEAIAPQSPSPLEGEGQGRGVSPIPPAAKAPADSRADLPAIWQGAPDLADAKEATRKVRALGLPGAQAPAASGPAPATVEPALSALDSSEFLPIILPDDDSENAVPVVMDGMDDLMMELEPARRPPPAHIDLPAFRRLSLAEIAARMRGR